MLIILGVDRIRKVNLLRLGLWFTDNHIKGTPGAYQENGSHDMLG